jgi:hypothetical protein
MPEEEVRKYRMASTICVMCDATGRLTTDVIRKVKGRLVTLCKGLICECPNGDMVREELKG